MQANEAIEVLRDMLAELLCFVPDSYVKTRVSVRDVLAATATIDPPAVPVLAAVGVEAQQCPVCDDGRLKPLQMHFCDKCGLECATSDDAEVNVRHQIAHEVSGQLDAALAALSMANARLADLTGEPSSTAGAAKGGNTTPEVPAAQPAADHAKRGGCCNNNCNQGRNCPERK